MNVTEARMLAEGWRRKASALEVKYSKRSPNLTRHVVVALELCAEELDELLERGRSNGTGEAPVLPVTEGT